MTATFNELDKKALAYLLSLTLIIANVPGVFSEAQEQQGAPAPTSSSGYSGQGAPQTQEELQNLVAPIALYPDALVAQILGAATFPDQIAVANYWLQEHKNLTGSALEQAVNQQSWDPSVKALTQFPSVLNNLAQNLTWTSSLGEAYHNQQSDVMAAIQTLRAQAKAAGNLKSSSQITVVQQTPQTIVIQPANPQIVYVPQYNPTVVYGTPYTTPGYSTGDLVATGLLSFGAGIAVGAMMSSAWGWSAWGCNWHGGTVIYNHNTFYGNCAWHGGYYSGYHNGYGYHNDGYYNGHYNNAFNRNYAQNRYNNFNRNVSGNTVNVNRQGAQNFNRSSDASRGWGEGGSGRGSTAFSGWGHSSGSDGGGWGSRSSSARGWGSRGGGGGWGSHSFGDGGFRGGGFRGGGGFRR